MLAPRGWAGAEERQPRRDRQPPLAPTRQAAHSGAGQLAAQIVMRCEQRPRRCLAANDVEPERGPPSKTPPVEAVLRGPVRPVRLQPLLDIVMTRDRDEARA